MKIDKNSAEWQFIKKHIEKKITSLREDNDNTALDNEETAVIRGSIKFAKEMLALEEGVDERQVLADNSYID